MLLTLRGENPSFWPSSLRACDQHAFFNILSNDHHHHHHDQHHHQDDHHHHRHLQLPQGLPCVSRQVQTQAVCENPFLVTLALPLSLSLLLLRGLCRSMM